MRFQSVQFHFSVAGQCKAPCPDRRSLDSHDASLCPRWSAACIGPCLRNDHNLRSRRLCNRGSPESVCSRTPCFSFSPSPPSVAFGHALGCFVFLTSLIVQLDLLHATADPAPAQSKLRQPSALESGKAPPTRYYFAGLRTVAERCHLLSHISCQRVSLSELPDHRLTLS